MKPSLSSVHVNAALSNVAIGYKNQRYVMGDVFPVVNVAKESDYYHIWTQDDIFRNEAALIRPGALAPRGGFSLSSTTYTADEYGFAWPIPDRVRDNMDQAVSAELNATNRVMEKLLIAREVAVAAVLTGTSWTGATAYDVGAGEYWDAGQGAPLDNFEAAIKGIQNKIGFPPNTCVMNWNVYRALRRHPDVTAYVGMKSTPDGVPLADGVGPKLITVEMLQAILDIPKIHVVTALYGTAKEGQSTQTYSLCLTDTVWIGYVTPTPAIDEPSAGYVFRKGNPEVRTYREEAPMQDVVEAREMYVAKATCLTAGALITDCLA